MPTPKLYTFSTPCPYKQLQSVNWWNGHAYALNMSPKMAKKEYGMLLAAMRLSSRVVKSTPADPLAYPPIVMTDNEAAYNLLHDTDESNYILAASVALTRQSQPDLTYTNAGSFLSQFSTREQIIAAAEKAGTRSEVIAHFGPPFVSQDLLLRQLEQICIGAYMLTPKDFDRDIAYIRAAVKLARLLYPHKPVMLAAWGIFQTDFTPATTPFTSAQMQHYVSTLKQSADSICIFDPRKPRDDEFISMLSDATPPTQPAHAPPTTGSHGG